MLFQTCIKLTFCLFDILVITVIARDRINSVGSLFFRDRILRFSENMPLSLKRLLSNLDLVAIQNSLDGFRNTLNVRITSKPVAGSFSSSSGVSLVVTGLQNRFLQTISIFPFRKLQISRNL